MVLISKGNNPDPEDIQSDKEDETSTPKSEDENQDKGTGEDKAKADTGDETTKSSDKEDEDLIFDPSLLEQHPEMKLYAKQLQGDYTRKMQDVPKEYRSKEKFEELLERAQNYEQIENDPTLAAMVDDYYSGRSKPKDETSPKEETKTSGEGGDMSDEEEAFFKRHKPRFAQIAREELGGELQEVHTSKDNRAKAELQELHPEVKVDSYWADILALGEKYPGMTYEDAFSQVVSPDMVSHYKGTSQAKAAKTEEDKKTLHIAGGGRGGSGQTITTDFKQLSAKEMRKQLPVHGE